ARWCVEGSLPRKGRGRAERLVAIAAERRTAVLYEAPHRLEATLGDLLAACGPLRLVSVARELTKLHEEVWRGTLDGALARAREPAPRGEHVLVVAGAGGPEPASHEQVEAAVAAKPAEGMPAKGAGPPV